MAYNDAPSTKVPPFPDQFQGLVEPVCKSTKVEMLSAHTDAMTILNRVIAVKANIDTEIAGFPRVHRTIEPACCFFRMACSVDTTTSRKGGVLN